MPQKAAILAQVQQRSLFDSQAPALARGIYVSLNRSSGSGVFGYPSSNRKNRGPICSENAPPDYDVAVDGRGNLIVPSPGSITIFKGPGMCGRKLGSFHTIWYADYPADATSTDAASGTIAVAVVQDDASGLGSIELCTLKNNCTTNLLAGNFVFAVAMSKNGDCWASSADPTALTYFKGCSGHLQVATGYENTDGGGIDIDDHGNLVSISCSVVSCSAPALYVYSGCRPKCKKIGGPFPLQGASMYGHLNENGTRFAAADYEYGQVDVYTYTPTGITYLYSFNDGLAPGGRMGAAYNPRSEE